MKTYLQILKSSKVILALPKRLFSYKTSFDKTSGGYGGVNGSNLENFNNLNINDNTVNKKEDLIEKHMYEPAPKNTVTFNSRKQQYEELAKLNPDLDTISKDAKLAEAEPNNIELNKYKSEIDEILEKGEEFSDQEVNKLKNNNIENNIL